MSNQAISNQRTLALCQSAYDHMEPPEYYDWDDDEPIETDEDDEPGYDGILEEG